jgi:transposase-like protein
MARAIDYIQGSTSTDPDFEIAEEKIRLEIDKATNHIKKLKARRDSLPARVTVADAQKGQEMVKLSTERKHLTNVLKMVAYHTESDLVELIRPHYSRVEDEGRTFIQMALQDTADIEPTEDQLRITLAPLSSPHRSRVLETLCETLNKTNTLFPGTQLQMRYVVACLIVKKVVRRAELLKGHRQGSGVLLIEAADNPRPVHKLLRQTQHPKQDHHLESPRA